MPQPPLKESTTLCIRAAVPGFHGGLEGSGVDNAGWRTLVFGPASLGGELGRSPTSSSEWSSPSLTNNFVWVTESRSATTFDPYNVVMSSPSGIRIYEVSVST